LNVLHLLNTKVHKGHRQHLAHLIVRGPRDAHGRRLRQCLQPRSNVHSIAKQVPSAHHHVTDVDTDAEVDVPACRETGVHFGEGSLRIHRTLHGVNCASELGKDTVARCVGYAAAVVLNELVEDRAAFG
jgi:hypothetical protein